MDQGQEKIVSAGDSMRVPLVSLMVLLLTGCGGAVKKRVRMDIPPAHSLAKTASLQQLVELVNERYAAVHSLSVSSLKVKFKSESRGEGYVEEYRSANGYFVVQEPDMIYVNILNPLTKSTLVAMGASRFGQTVSGSGPFHHATPYAFQDICPLSRLL